MTHEKNCIFLLQMTNGILMNTYNNRFTKEIFTCFHIQFGNGLLSLSYTV